VGHDHCNTMELSRCRVDTTKCFTEGCHGRNNTHHTKPTPLLRVLQLTDASLCRRHMGLVLPIL
jgi:hypothetical protein